MATATSSPPSRLTWLHLSDFHLRKKTGWEQDRVLETLLRDIHARFGQGSRPDMVFITGDIAFAGKDEEYKFAEAFIRKLCEAIQLPESRVFLVPGNHDIDIDLEEDAVAGARSLLRSANDVSRFLGNEGRRKTLFARQRAFREFANRLCSPTDQIYSPSSFSHTRFLTIGPINIRVLLLDSSWLAGGGQSDCGALCVGERQVLDCTEGAGNHLTFALMHHPFSWLREFEEVAIQNRVASHAMICLRGHVHSPDQQAIETVGGRLLTFTAGAGFETRTSNNSYVWNSLDLSTGKGESVVHRLNYPENRWIANEPQPWKLVSDPGVPPDLLSVHDALASAHLRHCSFATCLIAALKAEVPVLLTNHQIIYLNVAATIGTANNLCGELVLRLRHHFHWKAVWEPSLWHQHLSAIAAELNAFFDLVDALDPDQLGGHDQACMALIPQRKDQVEISSPVIEEVASRINGGDLPGARAVLERWKGQNVLRYEEVRELHRLEVFLLLGEGDAEKAYGLASERMQGASPEAADVSLAARCAFSAGQVSLAARLMHQALDLGISVDSVKPVALAIAGASGDSALTKRIVGRK